MVDLLHKFGLLNYSILHQIKYPNLHSNWKFDNCKQKPLLLFSCLDWGLGHTTRSVPLIKEFLILGCDLIVACNSIQKAILQPEFPEIQFVELEGYGISYGKTSLGTRFKILAQLIKILIRIKRENRWLRSFAEKNKVNGLISDNRYGFFHPRIPSVLITHQLQVASGYGHLADNVSRILLCKFINRFSMCWVPDFENHGLAGLLSHPHTFPSIPVQYIGPLSRFTRCKQPAEKKFDLLILISGPEPQRTVFEKIMLSQCVRLPDMKIALVRGLPSGSTALESSRADVFNHLDSSGLNQLICASEIVACRSGYTTIMDMMKLKKKMIVIPTPGQPEQEYLANHLSQHRYALTFRQHEFNLRFALEKAQHFSFNHIDASMNEYKAVLKAFADKISS
jgi:UDP-N-acetylglucosamine transferase subunit ALG13